MEKQEWEELDKLIEKDKAGILTPEEEKRFDVLFRKFMKEKLYMGGRDD